VVNTITVKVRDVRMRPIKSISFMCITVLMPDDTIRATENRRIIMKTKSGVS
jgi:hypothetical protein